MKQLLIFHRKSRLKFELASIARPDEHRLRVVTQAEGGVSLTESSWKHVDERITVAAWDLDHLREVVAGAVARYGTDAVGLVSHDEYSLMFLALLREEFGIAGPRPEQVARFTDKIRMKELAGAAGVRIPRHTRVDDDAYRRDPAAEADRIESVAGLPAFAKQVAGTCSEGARRIDTRAQLDAWLADCPDRGDFEVDEFVTGELLHVDCVVQQGRPVHHQISLDSYPNAECLTGKPLGTITLPTDDEPARRYLDFNRSCLDALGPLIDGTTHLEFFHTPDDELVFLEVAARSPGGDCPRGYEMNSGINYQETYFTIHLGLPAVVERVPGPYVAWLWYQPGDGVIEEYREPVVASKCEFVPEVPVGTRVAGTGSARDRVCRVYLTNDDFATLRRDFDVLRYEYEPCRYGA